MNNKAFTLIELMTVIIIMGVMLGFALPAFNSTTPYRRLVYAREQITSDLRLLRQRSCNQDLSFGIFSAAGDLGRYSCFQDANRNGQYDNGEQILQQERFSGNVVFTGAWSVSFRPNGELTNFAAANFIRLVNTRNQRDSIMLTVAGIVIR